MFRRRSTSIARLPFMDVSCDRIRDSLSAHLDGEDGPIQMDVVHRHVSACAPCRSFAAQVAELKRIVSAQEMPTIPDLTAVTIAKIDRTVTWTAPSVAVRRHAASHRWMKTLRWSAPIAAISALVPTYALGAIGQFHVSPISHVAPCVHTLMTHLHSARK